MNRSELVEAVVDETGLDRKQAEAAVKAFADIVINETKAGEKVSVFGFGTFTPTARAARMGRNPQTNTPVKIAASKSVRFAPASAFKETLNSKKAATRKAAAKKTTTKAAPAKKTTAAKSTAKTAAKKATSKAAAKTTGKRSTAKAAARPAPATTVVVKNGPATKRASAAARIVASPARRSSKR